MAKIVITYRPKFGEDLMDARVHVPNTTDVLILATPADQESGLKVDERTVLWTNQEGQESMINPPGLRFKILSLDLLNNEEKALKEFLERIKSFGGSYLFATNQDDERYVTIANKCREHKIVEHVETEIPKF